MSARLATVSLEARFWVDDPTAAGALDDLTAWLATAGIDLHDDGDALLVVTDRALDRAEQGRLVADGRPVLLVGRTLAVIGDGPLREAAGLLPGVLTPSHEIRVRRGPHAGRLGARWAGDLVVTDQLLLIDKTVDDVDVLLSATVALTDHPVATWRAASRIGAWTLGSGAAVLGEDVVRRALVHWVRQVCDCPEPPPVRVGLLGYGAIGHEHSAAVDAVDGLELVAVCDRNPARVHAARTAVPDLRVVGDAGALLADDDVDLVVVSTPPNTHVDWALQALRAGKHVVVEKPLALTVAGADAMIECADQRGLTLAVYQNRRWDLDYLAIKALVRSGRLGQVFHVETFIGGYAHPCNYWHSDEQVSGGAIYDWGSHYLDWVLDLLPHEVVHVTGATHKRVWHDVTNSDHSRVTIHFADGAEAEFVHSDLAAALKPKWYVLGTDGALVGRWRRERVVSRNAVGLLDEDRLAPAEAPATLEMWAPDGSRTDVALPPAPAQPFHRELADHLLAGLPMSLSPATSRRCVAVMQAATESAQRGSVPVMLP